MTRRRHRSDLAYAARAIATTRRRAGIAMRAIAYILTGLTADVAAEASLSNVPRREP